MNNYFPDKNWETRTCIELGIEEDIIKELEDIIPRKYSNTEGIIILKDGYIVFEKYYNKINMNSKVNVASITKSIMSALVGIAVDKGYIN